jgi:hypothetical protein
MQKFICLATISTAAISLSLAGSVRAQGVFVEPFPSTGYSSTTIYIPATETTTTTIDRVNSDLYPNSNSVTTSTTTTYTGGGYPFHHRRQQGSSTVIFQNNYPRAAQANCTTSVIGSPIPSPVALNSVTGQLCH